MIIKKLDEILKNREFAYVATVNSKGEPNAAPKFLLKKEGQFLYMVDHVMGMTYKNLKVRSFASVTVMDPNTLIGYQINGPVEIIEKGRVYKKLLKEIMDKEIKLTAKRIIEDVRGMARNEAFEISFPERLVIFKLKISRITEIRTSGKLKRENLYHVLEEKD
jgi:predicted pyridoxine 5'-phosphate oxidase superfamily flavin-nucleotide-binding protein